MLPPQPEASHPLICITGPTGSGKSALALHLASRMEAEIVNCDSLQVYRYFDIGTAKPPVEERESVPHHLFDIVTPDEVFTAGDYARVGREALRAIAGRGKTPIVVGGTGLYLRALIDGLFAGPPRDEAIRSRLTARETRRRGSLHRLLRRMDPIAARRIHANDTNKLIRALEVILQSRRPLSELHATGTPALEGFSPVFLGLDPPREELYRLLNRRCVTMFEKGLLEEVERILYIGYREECKPFEALGYKQALQVIQGKSSYEEALEEMQMETRRYAKRQWTWFKKDTRVSWIPGFGHFPQVQQNAIETLAAKGLSKKSFFL